MFNIFQKVPKIIYEDYSKSHLSKNKGEIYEANFEKLKCRKLMWDLEKKFLSKFDFSSYEHLDFACGTGRIISIVNSELQTGLDISKSMLKICKDKNKNAHIILGDFREEMNLKKEWSGLGIMPNIKR